jgi:hypothetical protein
MPVKAFFIFILCTIWLAGNGQNFYRFKAEITIKVKTPENIIQFTKGNVCYDKNIKKLLYNISFPEKEKFVSADTLLYKYKNNQLVSVHGNPLKPEFSIFHFILSNNLSDFGLRNSSFRISNVEKSDSFIVTKWIPPSNPDFPLGEILISTKNKRLHSVLIHSKEGKLISRQIFKKYTFVNGLEVPFEILTVSYMTDKKSYQIFEFDKVQINEQGHDADYTFQLDQ